MCHCRNPKKIFMKRLWHHNQKVIHHIQLELFLRMYMYYKNWETITKIISLFLRGNVSIC